MPPRRASNNNKGVPSGMQQLLEAQTQFLQMVMQHMNNNNQNNNPLPQDDVLIKFLMLGPPTFPVLLSLMWLMTGYTQ
jgi:F0F1-type ATP synthase membrane subunit a